MTKGEMQLEALNRARFGEARGNLLFIYHGFVDKGIPEAEIKPRENIFTYNAWKALGRQVMKGEHGVKIATFIEEVDKDTGEVTGRRPWTATVFHISQTKESSS